MGCLTGFIAKIILTAGNIAVSITAVCVITMSALIQTYVTGFGDGALPDNASDVLIGLETVSSFIICLGVLGMLVACCCQNKLFLYTYMGLGVALTIAVLTFAIMGSSNLEEYKADSRAWMTDDMQYYNLTNYDDPNNAARDQIYHDNQCCGIDKGPDDWNVFSSDNRVPLGCCVGYPDITECENPLVPRNPDLYQTGCFTQLNSNVSEIAQATMGLGIFFGILLLALTFTTCFCVKCTDAMPI